MATHRRAGIAALLFSVAWALCGTAAGDPRTTVAAQSCVPGSAVFGSVLADNFLASMEELQTNVSGNGYGTSTSGTRGPSNIFSLGQCLRDLSLVDCKLCFGKKRTNGIVTRRRTRWIRLRSRPHFRVDRSRIVEPALDPVSGNYGLFPKCYPRVGGRLFLDGCFGRYDNYSFFGEAVGPSDISVCVSGSDSISRLEGFYKAVHTAVASVTKEATRQNEYALGSAEVGGAMAFVLAQCWESLNRSACDQCLGTAADSVLETCVPAIEGRAL
ncbi:hypothetical protein ACQ4PT_070273 [Festuca glaucescens]